jgi:hypothetical protein
MSFTLNQLTEGIQPRVQSSAGKRLVEKWSKTGLLRGLKETHRENMASLLENQAAQLLREASSVGLGGGSPTASGDLDGFTNIAFPIVRRVFGGLVANDLVSIQPMSLPSGLLFYLDYTYGSVVGGPDGQGATYNTGSSIYGSPAGSSIQGGADQVGGQYDLAGSGFSRVHQQTALTPTLITSGAFGDTSAMVLGGNLFATGTDGKLLQFDPQLSSLIDSDPGFVGTGQFVAVVVEMVVLTPVVMLRSALALTAMV